MACLKLMLHCLSLSSCCTTLSSSRHASLSLHRLSSSSCCSALSSSFLCRLVVVFPLDALPSCSLVLSRRPLVVSLRQLIVASCLVVLVALPSRTLISHRIGWLLCCLSLHRPLVLLLCRPSLPWPCHHLAAVHRRGRQTLPPPPPPPPLNAVSIVHRHHSCRP